MSAAHPGQIRPRQLGPITGSTDTTVTFGAAPALGSALDPADLLSGAAQLPYIAIPMDAGAAGNNGHFINGSGRWQLRVDGSTVEFNAGVGFRVPQLIAGGEVPTTNLPLDAANAVYANSGHLDVRVNGSQGLSVNGSGEVTIQNIAAASLSDKGVVSLFDIGGGIPAGLTTVTGAIALLLPNAADYAPTTVQRGLRFNSSGAVGVRDGAYLIRDQANIPGHTGAGGTDIQTIVSAVRINGVNGGLGLNLNGNKIGNLADPTANQEAATKAYVDTATSGVGATLTPVDGFIDGTEGSASGVLVGERYISLDSQSAFTGMGSPLSHKDGDILTIVTNDTFTNATVEVPTNNDQAFNRDNQLAGGPTTDGPGSYKLNDATASGTVTGVWNLVAPNIITTAVPANPGPGVVGGVIPDKGLEMSGDNLRVLLSSNSGLQLTAGAANDELEINAAGGLEVSANVIQIATGGVTNTHIAAGTIKADRLNLASSSGLVTGDNQIAIKLDTVTTANPGLQLNANGLRIGAGLVTFAMLETTAGEGLEAGTGTGVQVHVDDTTLELNAGGIRVKGAGIGHSHIIDGPGLIAGTGNRIEVDIDTAIFNLSSGVSGSALGVVDGAIPASKLNIAGGGLTGSTTLTVNAAGGLAVNSGQVIIATSGVTHAKLDVLADTPLVSVGGEIAVGYDDVTLTSVGSGNAAKLQLRKGTGATAHLPLSRMKFSFVSSDVGTVDNIPTADPQGGGVNHYDFVLDGHSTWVSTGIVTIDQSSVEVFINGIPVGAAAFAFPASNTLRLIIDTDGSTAGAVPYALLESVTANGEGDCIDIIFSAATAS